jgi:hypothetical protein
VFKFVSRSLAQCQQTVLGTDVTAVCRESLQKLIDSGLVLQTKSQSEDPEHNLCHSLEVTRLGKATFKGRRFGKTHLFLLLCETLIYCLLSFSKTQVGKIKPYKKKKPVFHYLFGQVNLAADK